MTAKKRKSPRHAFIFKTHGGGQITAWAKVRRPKKAVLLELKASDVQASMMLGGVGNTQTCTMAVCAKRQADAFPHAVEGYIDWQYSRAYVVTKINKVTGLPCECVVYKHQDRVAQINDSKGGQKKLLDDLLRNGDRIIRLYPPPKQTKKPGVARGRKTGERSPRIGSVGARLRFAVAELGGVPSK